MPQVVACFGRRAYATVSTSRPLRKKGPLLSLEHFMQRKKALNLWKDIVRAINRIPPSSTKTEMLQFARAEFERHRNVSDIAHIRYLISSGKTQFDSMRRYIEEQAM